MMRRAAISMFAVALVAAACSSNEPPPEPAPQPTPTPQQPVATTDPDAERLAAEEAARRAAAERARLRAVLEELVYFDFDESRIRPDAEQALQRKLPILRTNAAVTLRITGHADERGSVEYNLALGLRRANAVRDYLAGFGITATRMTTETMGEDNPIDPGHNEAAWQRNRRAQFTITAGGDNLMSPGQ